MDEEVRKALIAENRKRGEESNSKIEQLEDKVAECERLLKES